MKERIRNVRKALGLTQTEFAEKLGIKQNTMANIETGRRNASKQLLFSICREFGVNLDYLLHGDEPMFAPKDVTTLDKIEQYLTGDNPFVRAVFMELANLSDKEWDVMYKFMRKVVEDTKKETGE